MKTLLKNIYLALLFLGLCAEATAQQHATDTSRMILKPVKPYEVEVTYNKTTHLLFPSAIRYVDLGSDYLIAGKAEDAENVLRIKASKAGFEEETNFSVITEDGKFYNFDVFYNPNPYTMNYDLLDMQEGKKRNKTNDALFEELGFNPPSLTERLLEKIYQSNERSLKHIAFKSYGITSLLNGIFIHQGKFYFHIEIRNKSNIPFTVDYITFKIMDKRVMKRTVVQEKPVTVIRSYRHDEHVAGNSSERNVYLLAQFTMSKDKVLLIELFEKNGSRHQVLKVENRDLVNAKVIAGPAFKIH